MMNVRGLALLILGLHLFSSGATSAQAADGWFGSGSETKSASSTKKSGMSSWLPSWSSSKPKATKPQKSSMVGDMTRSTKSAFNKTVSFLNPFDNKPAPKKPAGPPTSVPEWLGGERPQW